MPETLTISAVPSPQSIAPITTSPIRPSGGVGEVGGVAPRTKRKRSTKHRRNPDGSPKMLRRSDGRAAVVIAGRWIYLGKYGAPETEQRYHRLIAEWKATGTVAQPESNHAAPALTVRKLAEMYQRHAADYYGPDSAEPLQVRYALEPMTRLYGDIGAAVFGPRRLAVVQEAMVEAGWAMKTIRTRMSIIRRAFKWATANELVPPSTAHGLAVAPGLRRGRTSAPPPRIVRPIGEASIDAIKPYVSRQVWGLVQLLLWTGARPGEVLNLRPGDIDRSGAVWTVRLTEHKTADKTGDVRTIYIGPRGQDALRPFLLRPDDAFCFSPKEAEAERHAAMREARRSPMTPSQAKRGERAARRIARGAGRNVPTETYTPGSLRRAIHRACDLAIEEKNRKEKETGTHGPALEKWHPYRLRHSAATRLRRDVGIDLARVALGHRGLDATQVYAEADEQSARNAMAKVG